MTNRQLAIVALTVLTLLGVMWAAVLGQSGTVDCGDAHVIPTLHDGDMLWVCATVTPANTSTPQLSATPQPTSTSAPKPTQPTVEPNPGATMTPWVGAPLCPNHNPNQWHSIWDGVRGCHYDNVHGSNPYVMTNYVIQSPNLTRTITYGEPGALYGGMSISYPFETFEENLLKHGGYTINTAIDMPCEQQNYGYLRPKPGCIRSMRVQLHDDHASIEGAGHDGNGGRLHSMYTEAELCRDGICGLWQGGGARNDTGEAQIPYKTFCVNMGNRPACPDLSTEEGMKLWMDSIRHLPPYWAFDTYADAVFYLKNGYYCFDKKYCFNQPGNIANWENGSSARPLANRFNVANRTVGMNWRTHNASFGFDVESQSFKAVCPKSDCNLTGDATFVYELVIVVPASFPQNKDGIIEDYRFFTNPAGNLMPTCTSPSEVCVPGRVQNVRPGVYIYDMKEGFIPGERNWGDGVTTEGVRYFDETPAGVRCAHDLSKRCSWIVVEEHKH